MPWQSCYSGDFNSLRPRTQKALGIIKCGKVAESVRHLCLIQTDQDLEDCWPEFRYGRMWRVFGRPCPLRPRHGFVESRIVDNEEEVSALWREVREADPEGELLLTQYVLSVASGIVTPNSLAIGPGNDGATSGRKGSISLPMAKVDLDWTMGAIAEGECPYVEVVFARQVGLPMYTVQVRSGPQPPNPGGDWIPQDVVVSGVLEVKGQSLLEWERLVNEAPPGTVVYHPEGGPTSHYAVHAVQRKMPIVYGGKPEVGSTLHATGVAPLVWSKDEFDRGLAWAYSYNLASGDSRNHAMYLILLALHQSSGLLTLPIGSFAIGAACMLFVKLGFAAACGEYRHAIGGPRDRAQVYQEVLKNTESFAASRARVGHAAWAFFGLRWGRWVPGGSFLPAEVGGAKWGECTRAVIEFESALRAFDGITSPDVIVSMLNGAVNMAHNNGWWLNKFTEHMNFSLSERGEYSVVSIGGFMLWRANKFMVRDFHYEELQAWREMENVKVCRQEEIKFNWELKLKEQD